MRRIADIAIVAALCLTVFAAAALARSRPKQVTDPSADSPAGVIYSIPLDSARQDASPHHTSSHSGGGSGSGAGGGSGPTSGGGSGSARGATTGGGTASSGGAPSSAGSGSGGVAASPVGGASSHRNAAGTSRDLVPGGQPGSLIHSANGFGSSSEVPGVNAPLAPGFSNASSGTSSGPPIAVILALVVLALGVYVGARAWRPSGRGSG
jgi:hypothetical protein